MEATIKMTEADFILLLGTLHDAAVTLGDEGREDEPDVKIIWNLRAQIVESIRAKNKNFKY
jgi:hypothetical protein